MWSRSKIIRVSFSPRITTASLHVKSLVQHKFLHLKCIVVKIKSVTYSEINQWTRTICDQDSRLMAMRTDGNDVQWTVQQIEKNQWNNHDGHHHRPPTILLPWDNNWNVTNQDWEIVLYHYDCKHYRYFIHCPWITPTIRFSINICNDHTDVKVIASLREYGTVIRTPYRSHNGEWAQMATTIRTWQSQSDRIVHLPLISNLIGPIDELGIRSLQKFE